MDWDEFWKWLGGFIDDFRIPLHMLAIIVGAWLLRRILIALIMRVVRQVITGAKKQTGTDDTRVVLASPLAQARVVQRARTIGGVLSNVITWLVWIVGVVLLIEATGLNLTAFLATASLVSAIVAFGAQTIIRDLVNGIIMVFEDQFGVGDIVDLGPASGMVEAVGARITRLRDVNGTIWFVRNGEVVRVANQSLGWARVILDVAVPDDQDTVDAERVTVQTAQELTRTPKWRSLILEGPQLWGVQSVTDGTTVLRLVVKVRASAREDVARELRTRVTRALRDAAVPFKSLHTPQPAGLEAAGAARGAQHIATTPLLIAGEPTPTTASTPPPPPAPKSRRRTTQERTS